MSILQNQVAVVTGAGRGIGRAIALKFAAAGASVACVSRTLENSQRVAEEIRALGEAGSQFALVANGERCAAQLPLVGKHNIYNALAAVAVALDRGVSLATAAQALSTLHAVENRGQITQIAGATVINDCYNSNPKALDAMVDALASLPAQRRIVVAGEMLELGTTGGELHYQCGRHMAEKKIDVVVGVRGLAEHIVRGAQAAGLRSEFLSTPEEAGAWLGREARTGDAVLLKASRGVKLERALEVWKQFAVKS